LRRVAVQIPTTPINANTPGAGTVVAKVLVNFAAYVPCDYSYMPVLMCGNALNDLHKL